MNRQNWIREQIKRIKWEEGYSYKDIAEGLLDMHYHSFMNFMYGKRNLSFDKQKKLEDFIYDMME